MDRMPQYRGRNTVNYVEEVMDNVRTGAKLVVPPIVGIAVGYLAGAAADSLGGVGTVPYFNDFCHSVANLFRAVGVIGGLGTGIGLAYADVRDRIDQARQEQNQQGNQPVPRRRRRNR
ncbi:MAG: hypothetical protein V1870_02805 [Candidatus Aenigmatarchaeota archaeon]